MPHTMHSFEASASVPAFLIKLWKLVEDPSCNDLIAWSDSGTSFMIKDQIKFSKELLPQYFKHNNMASFIRQLNMYGFRKVMNYEKSGLRNDTDEIEFQHSFFSKGQTSLLAHIKRKIPNNKVLEPAVKSNNARDILTDLSSIREKQENMDNMLVKMKQENELLWRELTNMRKKHKAQEHVIQKVIQFLVSIVQRSNQNIGVQRKMPRMLQGSSSSQLNSQVTSFIDVLRNKNPNYITVPPDKMSPLGLVIHEVTDSEHDVDDNTASPAVKSPGEKSDRCENEESECPSISSLNSPIDTSAINLEPLGIFEPLPLNELNTDECTDDGESALGIPLEYISSTPKSVLSIPEEAPKDNVISLPDCSDANITCFSPSSLIFTTSSKSDFDDSLLSESLQTPRIPTIHIEDVPVTPKPNKEKREDLDLKQKSDEINTVSQNQLQQQQSEHNYQMAPSDYSNASSTLVKNALSNHLVSVEEQFNWLQDVFNKNQISSGSWNSSEANKLLGLFSTDDGANNETLAEEIADQTDIKIEPSDIIGNELVQFNPSMSDIDLDIEINPFFECFPQDTEVPLEDVSEECDNPPRNFIGDVLIQTDQAAATEAAEYLLNNGSSPKQKSPRRPKIQKLQKTKRRKVK